MKEFIFVELLLKKDGEVINLWLRPVTRQKAGQVFGRKTRDGSDRTVTGVAKIFFATESDREKAGYADVPSAIIGLRHGQDAGDIMSQSCRPAVAEGRLKRTSHQMGDPSPDLLR